MLKRTTTVASCTLTVASMVAINCATAQTVATPPASDTDSGSGLTEIVVTAQRRSEDINRVPISIAAYDQKTLDLQGVKDIADVVKFTPGIQYEDSGPVNRLSVRGISSSQGTTTTATYIDEVPVDARIGIVAEIGTSQIKVFDLERVEVDRGPQGTLFGAGAEAGIIRFITVQPSLNSYSGYARSELSTTQGGGLGYEAGAAVGGPIIDNELGFRVSAWYRQDPGYIDYRSPVPGSYQGEHANWANNYQLRGALKFAPIDNLIITASLSYQNVIQNSYPEYTPVASTSGQLRYTGLLRQPLDDRYYIPSIQANWDFGPVSLIGISSYLNRYNSDTEDTTSSIYGGIFGQRATNISQAVATPNFTSQSEYIEEIRLQSNDTNARVNWTVGAFYSNADQGNGARFLAPGLPAETLATFGVPMEAVFGSGLLNGSALDYQTTLKDQQVAGFGQADLHVTSSLTLTGGVRVARLSSSFTQYADGPLNGGVSSSAGSEHQTAVTPKYGITYNLTDNNMLYVTESKGVRIGGANPPLIGTPTCQSALQQLGLNGEPLSYSGDSLWSTELGSKNEFLDRRLQISADVYHIEWEDVQEEVHINACQSGFVANLGTATSNGAEFSGAAQVTNNLKLTSAVAYNDAHLTRTVGSGNAILGLSGDKIGPTAPWTATLSAQYDFQLIGRAAYIRLDDEYNSRNNGPYTEQHKGTVSYDPTFIVPPESNLVNARLGMNINGLDLSLFGSNLTNDHPLLVTLFPGTTENISGFTYRPRTIGVTAVKRW
jgi:iron complex outermembrane receptor protein